MKNAKIKVIISVRDIDLRLSLDLLLREEANLDVVGTATTPQSTLGLIKAENPRILLIEWGLCVLPKNGVIQQIRKDHPDLGVVLLGNRGSQERLSPCLGADAFLLIGSAPERLLSTINELIANEVIREQGDKVIFDYLQYHAFNLITNMATWGIRKLLQAGQRSFRYPQK